MVILSSEEYEGVMISYQYQPLTPQQPPSINLQKQGTNISLASLSSSLLCLPVHISLLLNFAAIVAPSLGSHLTRVYEWQRMDLGLGYGHLLSGYVF